MDYQVQKLEVAARPLAAVRRRLADGEELGGAIVACLDHVWAFIRAAGVQGVGHNVVVYVDGTAEILAGVEVPGPFQPSGNVVAASTPAGTAVTTAHVGPYSDLPGAFRALRDWCAQRRLTASGPGWEVYGDWNADESKLRTEVFLLIATERGSA